MAFRLTLLAEAARKVRLKPSVRSMEISTMRQIGCVIITITALSICAGCNQSSKQEESLLDQAEREGNERFKAIVVGPLINKAKLLSIKHEISEAQAIVIATNYMIATDYFYGYVHNQANTNVLEYFTEYSVSNLITLLSSQTGVDARKISEFIYDLCVWNEADKSLNND